MIDPKRLDELSAKLSQFLANSPAADMEKNARAFVGSLLGRLELVTREEYEVQRALLSQAQDRLARLEARLAELEKGSGG